jgi:hypothetical protein
MRQVTSLFAVCAIGCLRNACAYILPIPSTRVALRPHPSSSRQFPLEMLNSDDNPGLQSTQKGGGDDFWAEQKALAKEMTGVVEKSRQVEAQEKFQKRRLALVTDTAYFGFFIFCLLWAFFDNPFIAFSYSLGSVLGLAYAYGLGRYVEKFGGNTDEDFESAQGAGVGDARLAFLLLLIVFIGKFRSAGLVEVPAIAGFFTYQLASLSQGLQDIDD